MRKKSMPPQGQADHSRGVHELDTLKAPELDSTGTSEQPDSQVGNEMETPARTG
jgi:hypothetical protein